MKIRSIILFSFVSLVSGYGYDDCPDLTSLDCYTVEAGVYGENSGWPHEIVPCDFACCSLAYSNNEAGDAYGYGYGVEPLGIGFFVYNDGIEKCYIYTNEPSGWGSHDQTTNYVLKQECMPTDPPCENSGQGTYDPRCGPGMTGPEGECTVCYPGTFKATRGSEPCTICEAGKYWPQHAATDDWCQYCSVNSNSIAGSAYCTCNAGSTGPEGGNCAACVSGKYKLNTGSAVCTDCVSGKFSSLISATSDVCQDCPMNSHSLPGSALCVCNSGYPGPDGGPCTMSLLPCAPGHSGPDGGPCPACVAGSYKTSPGSADCTLCSENRYSHEVAATTSSVCMACPLYSTTMSLTGSDNIDKCFCNLGYKQSEDHTTCDECIAGHYDEISSRYVCSKCPAGTHSNEPGGVGAEVCEDCPTGTWSEPDTPMCNLCPTHSNSPAKSGSLTDCTCNAGAFGNDGNTCQLCQSGKYKENIGSELGCQDCPPGTFSGSQGAVFSTMCVACPADSHSASGMSMITACACNTGFTGPDGGPCAIVQAPRTPECGDLYIDSGEQCDDGNNVDGDGCSSTCVLEGCSPGYTGPNGGACTQCNAGKYKDIVGSSECQSCPPGTYNPGLTLVKNKTGVDGWRLVRFLPPTEMTWYDGNDHLAGTDSYGTAYDYTNRWSVPFGTFDEFCIGTLHMKHWIYTTKESVIGTSYSNEARTILKSSRSSTPYTALWYNRPDNREDPSITIANSWEKLYQANNFGLHGDWRTQAAIKDGGMAVWVRQSSSLSDSSHCYNCDAGKYSTSTGATSVYACAVCPPDSTSTPASTIVSDCTCNGGYSGPDGGLCTVCVHGKFKSDPGPAPCQECSIGTYNTGPELVEQKTGVGGWRLVRFLPPTATGWHPAYDHLRGQKTYGNAYDYNNPWSVVFGEFDEFCFGTLNLKHWLYTTKEQAIGESYFNTLRTVKKSSLSLVQNSVIWSNGVADYNPTICLKDYLIQVLYLGVPSAGFTELIGVDGGMAVWVRQSGSDPWYSDCQCNIGYTRANGGPCTACPAGTYKDTYGTAPCTQCKSHTLSTKVAATSSDACLECTYIRTY